MTTRNRIGLRTPDQSPPNGRDIYLTEKEISEWVDSLPVANIGETSRQIFKTLREHNRTLIPYRKRFTCTEHLRGPIEYIGTNLQKHFFNVGFPLSEKANRVAVLNRELHGSLATAYKCVIVDMIIANQGKTDQKLLSTAIHRAIYHLSKVMLLSVLVYEPYPTRTWLELHVLHRLACKFHLEAHSVEDEQESKEFQTSIEESYRRTALFCLSSPYKIRQLENVKIFNALLSWARHARLYAQDEAPAEASVVLKQDADMPPSHGSLCPGVDSSHIVKMDVSKLIEKLREQFDDATPQITLPGVETLDKNLLRQLIQLWSSEQKRTFVRTKLNFELRVAVGLGRIYQLIIEGRKKQAEEPEEVKHEDAPWLDNKFAERRLFDISAKFTLEPLESDNNSGTRRRDFEEFGPNSTDKTRNAPDTSISIWQNSNQASQPQSIFRFKTLNESAGGYCLDWRGPQIPKILVGEIIGIQSSLVSNQFGIGLVRWMKNSPQETLQVGIQMIAPNALAIVARHEQQDQLISQECLLLPEVGTSGQPSSFISPSFPFHVGDTLTMDTGDTPREIKLTRLLESSGSISQFQFIYTDDLAQQPNKTADGSNEDEDFENLWSTL